MPYDQTILSQPNGAAFSIDHPDRGSRLLPSLSMMRFGAAGALFSVLCLGAGFAVFVGDEPSLMTEVIVSAGGAIAAAALKHFAAAG